MPIYLLVPLHTSDPAWRGITRRDPIQVIAENEREARAAAWLRYGSSLKSEHDPWLLSRWVYAHVVEEVDEVLPLLRWPESIADEKAESLPRLATALP
jgi:hypothetical protein